MLSSKLRDETLGSSLEEISMNFQQFCAANFMPNEAQYLADNFTKLCEISAKNSRGKSELFKGHIYGFF
jgi:hypothetical protein